ncbi:hypothetical protein SAMN05660330_04358 [Desulforhopalus singaporensis]|uniref:Uncharacterized protein n=2 Tax=Desulforhopalus singaporensis TaxID=91360 RepID=A0A1H0W0L2_9BACT|nr:hypothetical protein SAMN05660330_03625 [Desulforhopalus singaporensis]SDP84270.1 hypothetical protein SAMN05660330_04358 [Desulforhopalus singaporensis]
MPRKLSDEDISAIVQALYDRQSEERDCRFEDIEVSELKEVIESHRHFNEFMKMSGNTIVKTVLVIGVGGFITVFFAGVAVKVKKAMGL